MQLSVLYLYAVLSQFLIYVNQDDSWLAETVYGIIEGSVGNKLKNTAKS